MADAYCSYHLKLTKGVVLSVKSTIKIYICAWPLKRDWTIANIESPWCKTWRSKSRFKGKTLLPDTYSHPKLYDIIIEENTLLPDAYILHSTQGWEVIENHCQVCQKVASGDLFHHTNNIRVENRTYIQHYKARVELDDGRTK